VGKEKRSWVWGSTLGGTWEKKKKKQEKEKKKKKKKKKKKEKKIVEFCIST